MGLATGAEVLKLAGEGGYAVGGFDMFNAESAQAIVAAAEAEETVRQREKGDPRPILDSGRAAIEKYVRAKIRQLRPPQSERSNL